MTTPTCRRCGNVLFDASMSDCPYCGTPITVVPSGCRRLGCVVVFAAFAVGGLGLMAFVSLVRRTRESTTAAALAPAVTVPAQSVRKPSSAAPTSAARPTARPKGPAADKLISQLRDPDRDVRRRAAQALGELKDPRAVEPLIALLDDESDQWSVSRALGEIGGTRAKEVLTAGLRQRKFQRVAGAADFLCRQSDASLDPLLIDLLKESKDLAVAQSLILSGRPRLVTFARNWAAERGFALERDSQGRPSWTQK